MPETTQFAGGGDNSQDTSLKPNHVLHNRYKIMGVLGGGGMGTVYQARDLNFTDVRKLVAIKEMQTQVSDAALRASMLKTFRREANILATLSHPAIPQIYDFFDLNDRAYLVMEYINGKDLEILLAQTKELPIEKVIDWAIDLCDVLDYLHTQKPDPIVFRDVKPSNIMIDSLGKVRLIDFGIAKTFVSGVKNTMIGTEGYSAPEQYKGDVSPQSDIYSLGATLHHILSRKDPRLEPPFSFHERPLMILNPKVPPALAVVIDRALTFNAIERFRTCREMREALEPLRSRSGLVPAAPQTPAPQPQPPAPAPNYPPQYPPQYVYQPQYPPPNYPPPNYPPPNYPPSQPQAPAPENSTDFFRDGTTTISTIQPKWTFKTEDEIRSGATANATHVFVGSYDSNLWALNLETGEMVWKFATKGGIASAPVIDEANRSIVFGSEDFSLYSVDNRSGRVNWTFATKARVRSAPRVAHNFVFFGSDDGKLYALAAPNGRQHFVVDLEAPIRIRPAVTNDLVIAASESGEVSAYSLSGNRKWTFRARRNVISSPYVNMTDNICYIGAGDSFLYALDANNGYNLWRYRTQGPIISSPAEGKNLVYFGSTDGTFYAINTQNGREKWKLETSKPIVASPIVHKDAVYFGGTDGYFYCLNADNGKERWKVKTGGAITATPFVAGDIVLIGSLDHQLYAFPLGS
jgi:serine/threonine protein kinase